MGNLWHGGYGAALGAIAETGYPDGLIDKNHKKLFFNSKLVLFEVGCGKEGNSQECVTMSVNRQFSLLLMANFSKKHAIVCKVIAWRGLT
jgi:hypothetical protein